MLKTAVAWTCRHRAGIRCHWRRARPCEGRALAPGRKAPSETSFGRQPFTPRVFRQYIGRQCRPACWPADFLSGSAYRYRICRKRRRAYHGDRHQDRRHAAPFGPRAGRGVSVATPNPSGAIRGTTTYNASQEKEARTYICCCYRSVEIANSAGSGQLLDTHYHNAIILPSEGGTAPVPYDRQLDHFDDDIAYLENQVGRGPR